MKNLFVTALLVTAAIAILVFADANAEIITTQLINGIQ